jgi:hypothetical protein
MNPERREIVWWPVIIVSSVAFLLFITGRTYVAVALAIGTCGYLINPRLEAVAKGEGEPGVRLRARANLRGELWLTALMLLAIFLWVFLDL